MILFEISGDPTSTQDPIPVLLEGKPVGEATNFERDHYWERSFGEWPIYTATLRTRDENQAMALYMADHRGAAIGPMTMTAISSDECEWIADILVKVVPRKEEKCTTLPK